MTADETRTLKLIQDSLGEWCLGDIKTAATADVDLPRLAFVGLAAWIDTVSILYSGGKKQADGMQAWTAFIADSGYLPNRMRSKREVRRLNDGLRNALLHEYGTRGVALTHGPAQRDDHWSLMPGTTIRVLHLESLIEDFETAFKRFLAALAGDPALRARVLPAAGGLLAPANHPRELSSLSPSLSASHSTATRSTIAASATGPLDPGRLS